MNHITRAFAYAIVAGLAISATSTAIAENYIVNRRHPEASDENPGTAEEPFKTISRAAKAVRPGDVVIIRCGVYREAVAVDANGTAEAPISFQAAPGERVVVTGADEITQWEKVEGEGNIFRTPWAHRFITHSKHAAHPDDDYHRAIGRAEQVFVQGRLLHQVLRREAMSRGSFYVDPAAKQLYVWSRDSRDLAASTVPIEASVRSVIWTNGGNWVHLSGLRFRYCANPAQQGAVRIYGHNNWIEDCTFEHANSIGAQFGGGPGGTRDILVRRCTFQHNGQMGFSAVRAHGLAMSDCLVRNNNTKGFNRGWEAGGNKIALCRDLVIERSRFLDNAGHGLWFDIGNVKCEVRSCLIADNDNAGIFYEISYSLFAHDNVIVGNGFGASTGAWGADGGISLSSSPECWIERNAIVGNKEGFQFREQPRATRRIDDDTDANDANDAGGANDVKRHPIWNHDSVIRNNYIANNRDWQVGGWFDIADGRHWPEKLQTGWEPAGDRPAADIAAEYKAKGQPVGGSLGKLRIRFEGNVYWAQPPQGLYLWGCTWRKHRKYADLDAVRKDLSLEANSRTAPPDFADFAARDLRLPRDHPAIRMRCYPTADVPTVRLGTSP